MKTVKGIISTAIIIFYNLLCHAQMPAPERWLAYQKNELKTCAYIFEGTVIDQSVKEGYTLTCSVIKITKIYKGTPQIKLGTIKVITEQSIDMKDSPMGLSKGETCIIFGLTTKSNEFQAITADNSIMLQTNDWVGFTGTGASWGWRGGSHYNTLDSLYSFFKENGVTVQEEAQQK